MKAHRGLELPLVEFESHYARVRQEVLEGSPMHSTVSISLWGLQLKFPEDHLAKDIAEAVRIARSVQTQLRAYESQPHSQMRESRDDIQPLLRQKFFAARSALISCFNLVEAYLNGLAWEFLNTHDTTLLSNRQKKLLDDSTSTTTRDKLLKYPEIISPGGSPWAPGDQDKDVMAYLDVIKPFRDSLVHPSPVLSSRQLRRI